jgi:hypothetical protein
MTDLSGIILSIVAVAIAGSAIWAWGRSVGEQKANTKNAATKHQEARRRINKMAAEHIKRRELLKKQINELQRRVKDETAKATITVEDLKTIAREADKAWNDDDE